eukprot:CAMPEP_0115344866 /NCGR_PEP_ID=MMETSP0270-20121206/93514_1 /TAXON_ID=71861 /ORGANISM="Scrippsiella trochoidea, Strain CCMP3099" /LENGTH=48 /DNA_ID= /DNA_START= /DNA_END= /DNA_ORIENTATION=
MRRAFLCNQACWHGLAVVGIWVLPLPIQPHACETELHHTFEVRQVLLV